MQDRDQNLFDSLLELSYEPRKMQKSAFNPTRQPGRKTKTWQKDENERLVEAFELYGKNWKHVVNHVGTRNYS